MGGGGEGAFVRLYIPCFSFLSFSTKSYPRFFRFLHISSISAPFFPYPRPFFPFFRFFFHPPFSFLRLRHHFLPTPPAPNPFPPFSPVSTLQLLSAPRFPSRRHNSEIPSGIPCSGGHSSRAGKETRSALEYLFFPFLVFALDVFFHASFFEILQ